MPTFRVLNVKGKATAFAIPTRNGQSNNRIFLPKLGWLRYRHSREALGELRNATVSLSCGKWFVSIQMRREVVTPLPQDDAVGINMGVARFATLSDGTFYTPLNSFKRHETILRRSNV